MKRIQLRMCRWMRGILGLALFSCSASLAGLPTQATDWIPFSVSLAPEAPGMLNARDLLHAPTRHDGFVTSRNGHFYIGNTRIRFWGVNLCFSANFPEHTQADQLAERLANFGVNCVRFHHMDSAPYPMGIFDDDSLDTLSPAALDRLDYLIAALKQRGIYSNLNLHVSRSWTRSHHWPDANKLPSQDKMIDLFHPELIQAQQKYARDLLTHVNAYTKLAYCDEPAIAMVEINNENTMFIWNGLRTLAKLPDEYRQMLLDRYGAWCLKNPMPLPTLFEPTAPLMHWMQFLQSVDESYFVSMRDFLKNDLHLNQPITGTIVLGPLGMQTQAQMDFADGHWYWDHPQFPGKGWDAENWRIHNMPMADNIERSALRVAASRIRGIPYTVTEYNHSAPNEWQAECIPFIATYGALQDWDAVFLFAYSHDRNYFKDRMSSFFDIEGNPAKMAMLPLGARIFLGGQVEPFADDTTFSFRSRQSLRAGARFYQDISGFLRELHGLKPDDYLSSRVYAQFDAGWDLDIRTERTSSRKIVWTSGDPGTGKVVFDDSHMAMFMGFPKDGVISLGPVHLETASPFIIALLLPGDRTTSLSEADTLTLCLLGRVSNTNMGWNKDRTSVGKAWGQAPTLIEHLNGSITLNGRRAKVFPIDGAGKPASETNERWIAK